MCPAVLRSVKKAQGRAELNAADEQCDEEETTPLTADDEWENSSAEDYLGIEYMATYRHDLTIQDRAYGQRGRMRKLISSINKNKWYSLFGLLAACSLAFNVYAIIQLNRQPADVENVTVLNQTESLQPKDGQEQAKTSEPTDGQNEAKTSQPTDGQGQSETLSPNTTQEGLSCTVMSVMRLMLRRQRLKSYIARSVLGTESTIKHPCDPERQKVLDFIEKSLGCPKQCNLTGPPMPLIAINDKYGIYVTGMNYQKLLTIDLPIIAMDMDWRRQQLFAITLSDYTDYVGAIVSLKLHLCKDMRVTAIRSHDVGVAGLVVDEHHEYIFYVNALYTEIHRIDYQASNFTSDEYVRVFQAGDQFEELSWQDSLAVDPAAREVYFTMWYVAYIWRCDYDGGKCAAFVSGGAKDVTGIAIDLQHGYLYWSAVVVDFIHDAPNVSYPLYHYFNISRPKRALKKTYSSAVYKLDFRNKGAEGERLQISTTERVYLGSIAIRGDYLFLVNQDYSQVHERAFSLKSTRNCKRSERETPIYRLHKDGGYLVPIGANIINICSSHLHNLV